MLFKKNLREKSKKKLLKKLFVSNLWDKEEKIYDCKLCGSKIISNWGDYIFQLYMEKDKSDIGYICSKCALRLKSSKEKIKVINDLSASGIIKMHNSRWQKGKWQENWKNNRFQ